MTTIRLATPDDAEAVVSIYTPIVEDTAISFEIQPPTASEICQRISHTLAHCPWLVCENNGAVVGYAYAGPHHERAAYAWSVNVSVYVSQDVRGCGVGRALYTALFEVLRLQGYYNAYAGITLPNPASVGLHEAMGFTHVGVYRQVGHKGGRWHDVGWWQLGLQEKPSHPAPPRPLKRIIGTSAYEQAFYTGQVLLRLQT